MGNKRSPLRYLKYLSLLGLVGGLGDILTGNRGFGVFYGFFAFGVLGGPKENERLARVLPGALLNSFLVLFAGVAVIVTYGLGSGSAQAAVEWLRWLHFLVALIFGTSVWYHGRRPGASM